MNKFVVKVEFLNSSDGVITINSLCETCEEFLSTYIDSLNRKVVFDVKKVDLPDIEEYKVKEAE